MANEKREPPKKFSDFIKLLKYRYIFSLLFSGLLVYYLGFIIRPDYVRDFLYLAILNACDTHTTYFGLKYTSGVELNPVQRKSFEKHGYVKTYLRGLVYIFSLLSVLYLCTVIFLKNIAPSLSIIAYSFGILALYVLVGLQPFLNVIEILKHWKSKRKV